MGAEEPQAGSPLLAESIVVGLDSAEPATPAVGAERATSPDKCRAATPTDADDGILDLLVIGAGPHALSMLTRLVDDDPDLLTEFERAKMTVNEGSRLSRDKKVVREHIKKRFDAAKRIPKTLVVDSHGTWMAQWAANFKAFGIKFLRSHYNMHPDPYDFQSLGVWATQRRREYELKQMDVVDRDKCRKSGYYGPFVVPDTDLFLDVRRRRVAVVAAAAVSRPSPPHRAAPSPRSD